MKRIYLTTVSKKQSCFISRYPIWSHCFLLFQFLHHFLYLFSIHPDFPPHLFFWLDGVGLATLPCKTISYCHIQIMEQTPGSRLWSRAKPWQRPWPDFVGVSNHSDLFDAKASWGPNGLNDRCRAKSMGPLQPEWGGRIPSPYFWFWSWGRGCRSSGFCTWALETY